jgi:hypothetical protein
MYTVSREPTGQWRGGFLEEEALGLGTMRRKVFLRRGGQDADLKATEGRERQE